MTQFPDDMDLILVAILPDPRDLDIARMLGWYRIPLKSAPKVIAVDYLAFYQTGAFGGDNRWAIKMIAAVKGNELTTRSALIRDDPHHPRANEEYFKIQIGPLINLEKPILADRWRRITFFYTTGALLKEAVTIRDLIVSGEDRYVLWNKLRERMGQNANPETIEQDFSDWNLNFLKLLGEWEKIKDPDEPYEAFN
jgi:hypothetical protein